MMNEVWNLDPIYKGFDDPAFASDMELLAAKVEEMNRFSKELATAEPLNGLRTGIALEEETSLLAYKLAGYAQLRQSTNTRDPEAGSFMGRIMGMLSGTAGPEAAFRDWASKLPNLMELVRGDELLCQYEYLFSKITESSKFLLPGMGEEIMARMRMSGTDAWSELQGYLTSTVPVSYRGNTTNLSTIRNLAYDPDPQVRKDAYEAELACYERIEDAVAFAMNSIKLETISNCKLRGYESPLDMTLRHSNMKRQTLEAMLRAMDAYLPKFWQYLKAKAKALGHENGLPWYDLFAPMGNATTKFTAQEARDYLVEQFSGFDKELADMVKSIAVSSANDCACAMRIWWQRPLTMPGLISIPETARWAVLSVPVWNPSEKAVFSPTSTACSPMWSPWLTNWVMPSTISASGRISP